MFQRQRNPRAVTAHLPETLAPDGSVLAACQVEPGGEVDWPFPLAGFEGWATELVPATPGSDAADSDPDAAAPSTKSRTKAAASKAAETPEVTA